MTPDTSQSNEKHKKIISDYFSREWNYWEEVYSNDTCTKDLFHRYEIQKRKAAVLHLAQSINSRNGIKVLDAGCGTGVLMEELRGSNNHIIGIDLSEKMLAEAKRKLAPLDSNHYSFVRCDAENLPFKDQIFGMIIGIGLMEYIDNEKKFYKEIARVIRNQGLAIFSFPNLFKLRTILDPYTYTARLCMFLKLKIFLSGKKIEKKAYNPFSNEDFSNKRFVYGKISKEIKAAGFQIKKKTSLGFGPITLWKRKIFSDKISIFICTILEKTARIFFPLNFVANRWIISLTLQKTN